jgi:hypothetical protein
MAARKRSELERSEEIFFLVQLARAMGDEFGPTVAANILNERRAAAARETARALGASDDEAEQAARDAQLTPQQIGIDVRVAQERLQQATNVASALWIDDDIAEVSGQIAQLARLADMILEDLQASRSVRWTRTKGEKVTRKVKKPGQDKEVEESALEPTGMVTHAEDGPARAALYMVYLRNLDQQAKLRAERRQLRFGRQWFPEQRQTSFTEALLQTEDPEAARKAALAMLARDIASLCRDEQFALAPATAQSIQAERLRLTAQAQRVRQLQEFVEVVSPADGPKGGVEVVVSRRTARPEAAGA